MRVLSEVLPDVRRGVAMTDSNATELLRKLLDECGISHIDDGFCTTFDYYTDPHTATESMDGTTLILAGLTPEQVVAVTHGARECKMHPVEWYGTPQVHWSCSECDASIYDPYPNFCPCCGRQVKR